MDVTTLSRERTRGAGADVSAPRRRMRNALDLGLNVLVTPFFPAGGGPRSYSTVGVDAGVFDDEHADVCRLDARGIHGAETLLSRIGAALGVGAVSGDVHDQLVWLAKRLTECQRRPVLVLERPEQSVAVALFGRLRDELWELPVTWLVVVPPSVGAVLDQPPSNAFFEVAIA